MKRIIVFLILITLIAIQPINAEEFNYNDIMESTKYYKTIINKNNHFTSILNNSQSITIEVSKEEYDNYNGLANTDAFVETIYKKITSSISQNGSYYKYTGTLTWKTIPSVRSYDIFGIGFYSSVKVRNNNVHFSQNYCLSNGSCYTSSTHYPQIFSGGAGTTFLLPSGNLTSLNATMYFDVEKNGSGTIVSQLAAADHSHAVQSISLTNAKKYTVSGGAGIILNGVSSYYDAINPAKEYWTGSW